MILQQSNKHSVLFDLPETCITSICFNWLTLKELNKLDSSLCNKALRFIYYNAIKSFGTINYSVDYENINPNNFYNWLSLRNISINKLTLTNNITIDTINQLKIHVCKRVNSIVSNETPSEVLQSALEFCSKSLELLFIEKSFKKYKTNRTNLCPNLSELHLCYFIQAVNSHIMNIISGSNIIRLVITHAINGISKKFIKLLNKLTSLQFLNISCIENISMNRLNRLFLSCNTNLKSLSISSLSAITNDIMLTITSRLINIETLTIHQCPQLTDISLYSIINNCYHLQHLSIIKCDNICGIIQPWMALNDVFNNNPNNDNPNNSISRTSTKLTTLLLISCDNLESLMNICQLYTSSLTSLTISYCRKLKYNILTTIFNYLINLETLDLSGNISLYGYDLSTITQHQFIRLTTLNLKGCEGLSEEGLINISNLCPSLKILNLEECYNLTTLSIEILSINCIHIIELYLSCGMIITETMILSIFTHMLYLKVFSFSFSEDICGDFLLARMINLHPKLLTTLIISNFQVTYIPKLIQLLDKCNQLRILTLYCINDADHNVMNNCIKILLKRIYIDLNIEVMF